MAHLQEKKLLSGSVSEKKGCLYWVLSFYVNGVRKQKWIPTGMKAKGNKTRAKDMLPEIRREWTQRLGAQTVSAEASRETIAAAKASRHKDMPFLEWLYVWLENKYRQATQQTLDAKPITLSTYAGYAGSMKSTIQPYFASRRFTLSGITKDDIKAFYNAQLQRGVKTTTAKHYHAVIHNALNYAIDEGLLASNPSDRIAFPKQPKFKGDFYRHEEALALFGLMQGTKIEIPVMLASFYGLRRSEVIGLKWNAFDFTYNCFTIQHTVTVCNIDGKSRLVPRDKTKTQSSLRTYPLIPYVRERLLAVREQQAYYKKLCGRSYIKAYDGYVCVDEIGDLLKPGYVTNAFPILLKKHKLRHIRFHDLRHTCAALLLANGVPMERIQEWLGHSEIGTTNDIYGHLEFITKVASAETMASIFDVTQLAAVMEAQRKAAKQA